MTHLAEGTELSRGHVHTSPFALSLTHQQHCGGTRPLAAVAEGERRLNRPGRGAGEARMGQDGSVGKRHLRLLTKEQRSLPTPGTFRAVTIPLPAASLGIK